MTPRRRNASAVFISYRRDAGHGHAQTFYRALTQVLVPRRVFLDVGDDGIVGGEDWRVAVSEAIERADAVLLLLDPDLGDFLADASGAVRFELEKYRSRYRFFLKHYGPSGARRIKTVTLIGLWIRRLGYGLLRMLRSSDALENRLAMYRVAIRWNSKLDPMNFLRTGEEPDVGYEPLAPAPPMLDDAT